MNLSEEEARRRLANADHGILCTIHPDRGVDAVPVVFALDPDGFVGVPIDRVKPKSSQRLRRERNLEHDPRATLLVEHWDRADWAQLWWARAELRWVRGTAEREEILAALLSSRYSQYEDHPFDRVLVFALVRATGWAATGP